jgi:hypothetical protein
MWQVVVPFILAVLCTIGVNNAFPAHRADGNTHLYVVFFGVWIIGTVYACCAHPTVCLDTDYGVIDCEEVC